MYVVDRIRAIGQSIGQPMTESCALAFSDVYWLVYSLEAGVRAFVRLLARLLVQCSHEEARAIIHQMSIMNKVSITGISSIASEP